MTQYEILQQFDAMKTVSTQGSAAPLSDTTLAILTIAKLMDDGLMDLSRCIVSQ